MNKIIIFDTETTGLLMPSTAPRMEQPQIIELGAIIVHKGEIVKELSQLLDPGCDLPPKITKITGIKDADLRGQPTFLEFLPRLKKFFRGTDLLVCHNAPFDVGMIRAELARNNVSQFPFPKHTVCTVQEFRHEFGRRPRMVELYEKYMGKPLEQTHRALDDCKALHEILLKTGLLDIK